MAVASLVLGILGVVLGLVPFLFFVGIGCAAVGLVLGAIALRRRPRGKAIAGTILSAIGLAFGITMWQVCASLAADVSDGVRANLGKDLCTVDGDCAHRGDRRYCVVVSGVGARCVRCRDDRDCAGGKRCQPTTFACE